MFPQLQKMRHQILFRRALVFGKFWNGNDDEEKKGAFAEVFDV